MKKFRNVRSLLLLWPALAVCSLYAAPSAQFGAYQHGTVVRMRMTDCLPGRHGFMVAFGGPAAQAGPDLCPEYTLVSEKIVFVIVGRSSDQLVPLADVVDFRVHNSEIVVRVDDAPHESKFNVKEMILRLDWDMAQKHLTNELNTPPQPMDSSLAMRAAN